MELTKKNIEDIFRAHEDHHKSLHELGKIIIEEFKSVKLIGEIEGPDGDESYEALRDCLKLALREFPQFGFTINETNRNSRAVLSLFFVWAGILHYGEEQGHELWPRLFEELGFERSATISQSCGELFLKCLRENALESFPSLKKGHVYLARILLHGLIPERHIDRFIDDIILEKLSRPHGLYETGFTIVENWRDSLSASFPKPIERFLDHGHPVNVDLVERILQMAKRWDEDDPTCWWQWGIPKYMVDAFRRCENKKKCLSSKKLYKARLMARPIIYFDPTKENEPVLLLPSQNLESQTDAELWFRPLDDHASESRKQIKLDIINRSGDGGIFSQPLTVSIGPSVCWHLRIGNRPHLIEYAFPEAESGNTIPIYIVGTAGRLIELGTQGRLPEEIAVIFPENASLDIEGAIPICEPISLSGLWEHWKYIYYSLGGNGAIGYCGPDPINNTDIKETISFLRYDSAEKAPYYASSYSSPSWLKTSDRAKIIFKPDGLQILFPDHSYALWRRGIGRLRRLDIPLDKDRQVPFRLSAALKTDAGWALEIPEMDTVAPGAYEVQLQGAIGVEELVLPFIYMPVLSCRRNFIGVKNLLATDFSVEFSNAFPIEALENTEISTTSSGRALRIYVKEDCADAYCALQVFSGTVRPTVLLLERSDIRWVRHSETGPVGWRFWRAQPEIIPIQRLDEIYDSRALIEMPTIEIKPGSGESSLTAGKLMVFLLGRKADESTGIPIMSYEASRFPPRSRNLWLIELKKLADQLKDLTTYHAADLVLYSPAKDLIPLFSIWSFPEYQGFEVGQEEVTAEQEKLHIGWIPQANEPQKNRVLKAYPVVKPNAPLRIPLDDGKSPPLTANLRPLDEIETWCAQIEVIQGRFLVSQGSREPGTPKALWIRRPTNWFDWLEIPNLVPDQYTNHFLQIEHANGILDLKHLPFSYFLGCFCLEWAKEQRIKIESLVGQNILREAIPFAPGHVWEIKTDSRTKMTLKVASPYVEGDSDAVPLGKNMPAKWGSLLSEGPVEFEVQEDHPYLGERGTIWTLSQDTNNLKPLMSSEWGGNLEIDYWIADAADESEISIFMAHLPLQHIWDKCPHLPILDHISQIDSSVLRGTLSGTTINDKDKESAHAIELINRWANWMHSSGVNPFIKRIFQGRLEADQTAVLSATIAWITRLRAHGYEKEILKSKIPVGNALEEMQGLYAETLDFVKTFLPRSLLRDLILSELIISWYWNKIYYSK